MEKLKTKYVKPIEHFKKDMWGIQSEQTHGIKGLVKISAIQLEGPRLGYAARRT
jgi:hypothetical protein